MGLSGLLNGFSISKKYAPKTNKAIPKNCNVFNLSPKKKYANNATNAGLKLSNGAVIETSICLIPLAKNKKATVANTDEIYINNVRFADIGKLILSKKIKNKKNIKIDRTVDISRACTFNKVFFSTIILIPKNIADIIAKKYHSIKSTFFCFI